MCTVSTKHDTRLWEVDVSEQLVEMYNTRRMVQHGSRSRFVPCGFVLLGCVADGKITSLQLTD